MPSKILLRILILWALCYACKAPGKLQTLKITVSGTPERPAIVSLSDLFGGNSIYRDHRSDNIFYRFAPGYSLSIRRDTSFRLFFSDAITISTSTSPASFTSSNPLNKLYNHFFNDYYSDFGSYKQKDADYLLMSDFSDSLLKNKNFFSDYLALNNPTRRKILSGLFLQYNLPDPVQKEILAAELHTNLLGLEFFFTRRYFPLLDSLSLKHEWLIDFQRKINALPVSIFSLQSIASLSTDVAYMLSGRSIYNIKSRMDIENYYKAMHLQFARNTTMYDYLVSCLEVQAIKFHIPIHGKILKKLKRDAKRSIFKNYVKNEYSTPGDTDLPSEKNFYTVDGSSFDLQEILGAFGSKPILIDFWASWCLRCLKEIPHTLTLKEAFPNLEIVFISLDKSPESWKIFLYEHGLFGYDQYRSNSKNQDSVIKQITEIPRFALVQKNGIIKLYEGITDTLLLHYYKNF